MLKKIQAGTGVLFAAFLAVHLINTWLAAFGAGVYDGLQGAVRVVYQFPPIEALLLASLAVHMVVGVMRIVKEPKRVMSWRGRIHRYTGFFLMTVIIGHILAVRGASWFYDVYPGFEGLAFSVAAVPGYFYPYYFLLGMAGFYHGLNGLGIALTRLGWTLRITTDRLRLVSATATVLMTVTLLALGGLLFDVGDPSRSGFARLAMEIVGGPAP